MNSIFIKSALFIGFVISIYSLFNDSNSPNNKDIVSKENTLNTNEKDIVSSQNTINTNEKEIVNNQNTINTNEKKKIKIHEIDIYIFKDEDFEIISKTNK